MLTAILLYVLMVVGFIGAGWITNAFFRFFRKKNEEGRFDAIGAFILWIGLFGSYSYLVTDLLHY